MPYFFMKAAFFHEIRIADDVCRHRPRTVHGFNKVNRCLVSKALALVIDGNAPRFRHIYEVGIPGDISVGAGHLGHHGPNRIRNVLPIEHSARLEAHIHPVAGIFVGQNGNVLFGEGHVRLAQLLACRKTA